MMKTKTKTSIKGSRGSIALEAAVSISIFIALAAFMLTVILAYQIEAAVAASLDNTAAEISLMIPVANMAVESNESVENTLAELEQIDHKLAENQFAARIIDSNITDVLSSVLFSDLILERCMFWLEDADSGQSLYLHLLESMEVELFWQTEHNILMLKSNIEINSLFGPIKRESTAIVPIWTGKKRVDEKNESEADIDVWNMDNFSRGIFLRENFGAELPLCYPVIASFKDGEATAIRSMDLTAATYQSADKVISTVADELVRLAEFEGFAGTAVMPAIESGSIRQRRLKLIIPENSPANFESEVLPQLEQLALSSQIKLEIIRYLESSRYEA